MLTGPEQMGTVAVCAGAALLLWAGVPKLSRGQTGLNALTGGAELALALCVLLGPGRYGAVVLAAVFGLFTLVHVRDIWRGRGGADDASCDCFEAPERVSPARAALLTAALAGLAAAAAGVNAPSLRQFAGADSAALAWLPSAALLLAVAWRLAFSGLAPLERLVDRTAAWMAGGSGSAQAASTGGLIIHRGGDQTAGDQTAPSPAIERRSFLLSVAVVGSALAAAPMRYLLYPGTALAAVVRPSDCSTGLCTDGYTGFCCEINQGSNTCPTGTFPGGWWMCTDYRGRQLCSAEGVRYYVDCNALPGMPFPGGCRCANDNCNHRKVACNVFRYGQCNTDIEGTTAVVCRMITCENPARLSELNCSSAVAIDDSTCGHDVPCLEPHALQLAGAGGA